MLVGRFAVEETDVGRFEFTLVGASVRLGQARQLFLGEIESRVFHPQRIEQPPLAAAFRAAPRDDLGDPPAGVDSRLAVGPFRARREADRLGDIEGDDGGQRLACAGLVGGDFAHARGVREQVADRDLGRFAVRGLESLEFRQVFLDRIVNGEQALVLKHEQQRGENRLAHRRDPEDGVRPHRLARVEVRVAGRVEVKDPVGRRDQRHRAGDFLGGDVLSPADRGWPGRRAACLVPLFLSALPCCAARVLRKARSFCATILLVAFGIHKGVCLALLEEVVPFHHAVIAAVRAEKHVAGQALEDLESPGKVGGYFGVVLVVDQLITRD